MEQRKFNGITDKQMPYFLMNICVNELKTPSNEMECLPNKLKSRIFPFISVKPLVSF